MNALHRAMNRLLLLIWLLAGCSPPQVVEPPAPCPLGAAAKRALPLVADHVSGASWVMMHESSQRQSIRASRTLVFTPGRIVNVITAVLQCTGEEPASPTRCSTCAEQGTCPLPDSCWFTKCTGPDDAAMARAWYVAGEGFEYTPADTEYAEVRYRYRGDVAQEVARTFEGDIATVTVSANDDLLAIVDGETVDLGHALRGSMRVQGEEVLDFEVTATFGRLAPEHLVEVRASQSRIEIFVDGERLGVASRTADNHRVIYWFGACR